MELVLTNGHGIRVTLCDTGAAVRRIETPDRLGRFSNIALSPVTGNGDLAECAYAGATLGPSAGRVPDGLLTLGDRRLSLAPNEGPHHLHGGPHGLTSQRWTCEGSTPCEALFCCDMPAGLDGYPGNRRFTVAYDLSEDDCLTIRLRADTDTPTWINMSNHLYWNLSGDFTSTVYDHRLRLSASHALWSDADHIPALRGAVDGTPFDLRGGALLGERLSLPDPQLVQGRGFNHFFQLESGSPAATLRHEASGRTLVLTSDLPWLAFYTGGYLDEHLSLEGGLKGHPACALALEPQYAPVTRQTREATPVTTPEQPYDHWIAFRWGVEK